MANIMHDTHTCCVKKTKLLRPGENILKITPPQKKKKFVRNFQVANIESFFKLVFFTRKIDLNGNSLQF